MCIFVSVFFFAEHRVLYGMVCICWQEPSGWGELVVRVGSCPGPTSRGYTVAKGGLSHAGNLLPKLALAPALECFCMEMIHGNCMACHKYARMVAKLRCCLHLFDTVLNSNFSNE